LSVSRWSDAAHCLADCCGWVVWVIRLQLRVLSLRPALNAFFLLYIGALLLAMAAMVLVLSRTNANAVAAGFSPRTPVKLVGGYLGFRGCRTHGRLGGDVGRVCVGGTADSRQPGDVQAGGGLDLTLMVPALALGGILLWRRHPWGYLIAILASVQGALYLTVLALQWCALHTSGACGGAGRAAGVWGTLAVATASAAVLLLLHVRRCSKD
jgi:hypothetical protein